MKDNIALIGFMGAGKTAVGKLLAKESGKTYIELDALIEERDGKSIADIFKLKGEKAFRQLEIDIIKETAGKYNQVIACGGGAVLNRINTDRLKQNGVIVYLEANAEAIYKRTSRYPGKRPLLNVADRMTEIEKLLRERTPLYEDAADITVDTSDLNIREVTARIMEELERYEGHHK